MKKFLFVLIVATFTILAGCGNSLNDLNLKETNAFKKLNAVSSPNSTYNNEKLDEDFIFSINSFTNETIRELFTEDENYVYSPLSIYMALSMILEGADNETYNQLATLMGVSSLDSLRSNTQKAYSNNYYSNDDGIARLANSIWIRENYPIKEEYVNNIATNYYADAYQSKMDNETAKNLAKWINHHTFDFLNMKEKDVPNMNNLVMLLVNTVYFDNKWKVKYEKSDISSSTFYGLKEEKTTSFMCHKMSTKYYSNNTYTSVLDYFQNNNTIEYILPSSTSSVNDIINNKTLMLSIMNQENKVNEAVTLYTPKFDIENRYDLKEPFMKLGVVDMFTDFANFSKMSDNSLYVDLLEQIAKIELTENGVKAAAVSWGGMTESAAPIELIVKLDHPFIYIIRDANNTPLFIGVVNNL